MGGGTGSPISKEEAENLKKRLDRIRMIGPEERAAAAEILDRRYEECDTKGHKELRQGYCHYCFRHAHYSHSKTDHYVRKRNEGLHWTEIPVDTPLIEERQRAEIKDAKDWDRIVGIKKIVLESEEREGLFKNLRRLLGLISSS